MGESLPTAGVEAVGAGGEGTIVMAARIRQPRETGGAGERGDAAEREQQRRSERIHERTAQHGEQLQVVRKTVHSDNDAIVPEVVAASYHGV